MTLLDDECAKLVLTESAKKVSDLKAKQWEISKNALLILVFLGAAFQGDARYSIFQNSPYLRYSAVVVVIGYFVTIFQQAAKNEDRYKNIYRIAADQLYPETLKDKFYPKNTNKKEDFDKRTDQMIEDEGRLRICLFAVVLVFSLFVGYQIYTSAKASTGHPVAFAGQVSAPHSATDGQ